MHPLTTTIRKHLLLLSLPTTAHAYGHEYLSTVTMDQLHDHHADDSEMEDDDIDLKHHFDHLPDTADRKWLEQLSQTIQDFQRVIEITENNIPPEKCPTVLEIASQPPFRLSEISDENTANLNRQPEEQTIHSR